MTALKDLFALLMPLKTDSYKCYDECKRTSQADEETKQFWRRALVKANFAFVEGVIYRMKQEALEEFHRTGATIATAEQAMLLEVRYDIDEKGSAVQAPAKISLTKNVKFSFEVLNRAYKIAYQLKLGDTGWDAFRKAIKIRDRLTHPKRLEDLTVADAELMAVIKAQSWFELSLMDCIKSITVEFDRQRIALKQEIRALKHETREMRKQIGRARPKRNAGR